MTEVPRLRTNSVVALEALRRKFSLGEGRGTGAFLALTDAASAIRLTPATRGFTALGSDEGPAVGSFLTLSPDPGDVPAAAAFSAPWSDSGPSGVKAPSAETKNKGGLPDVDHSAGPQAADHTVFTAPPVLERRDSSRRLTTIEEERSGNDTTSVWTKRVDHRPYRGCQGFDGVPDQKPPFTILNLLLRRWRPGNGF